MQRAAAAWIVGIISVCANCRVATAPSIREIGNSDWVEVFRVPEGIYSMTSAADGTLFVIAFSGGGPVYRSRAGHDTEWTKAIVTGVGQPIFRTIYAASATTVFGYGDGHLLRWDEGKGITDFGAPGPSKFCGMFDMPLYAGFGVTNLWGRNDHDVFAVGSLGMVMHYDGAEWKPMRTSIRDEIKDICAAQSSTTLFSVGGNEHNVFAAGSRYLSLSTNGEWTEVEQPKGVGDGAITQGIATQGGTVFFGGGEFIRTNTNLPQFNLPLRLFAFTGQRLQMLLGYDNVLGMNGGGAQPGSAAVFWGFDNDLLIIDGSNIRALRMRGFRSVRGAVAVGHTIYVAGSPHEGDEDIIVRLR